MFSWFIIKGQSMEPLCQEGDFVVGEKLSFLLSYPKVGQLVLLSHPLQKKLLLKRVVKRKQAGNKWFYWVQGDNASLSTDSRNFGWVPHNLLLGRARVIHKTPSLASDILS